MRKICAFINSNKATRYIFYPSKIQKTRQEAQRKNPENRMEALDSALGVLI